MNVVGQPLSRADGRLKVTGGARYTAEWPLAGMTHAVLVESEITCGRVLGIDMSAAKSAPGVLAVLTRDDMPRFGVPSVMLTQSQPDPTRGSAGQAYMPLQDDQILYNGQHIALVVAETLEAAMHGASLVKTQYASSKPTMTMDENRAFTPVNGWPDPAETTRGDFDAGWSGADIKVDQTYQTAMQHHVTMEPHATVASWQDDELTLYEPSTWVGGVQQTVAIWLNMPPEKVRVINDFVGGSFGAKGPTWPHVAFAAVAARHVARPVKLALTRQQTFWSNGYRPLIRHHILIGALRDGTLIALRHDALSQTASFDKRIVAPVTKTTPKVYDCLNVVTTYKMAHVNLSGPFTFRGPGETPGLFALESAMDELSYALHMDPIALRLKNYAETDPEDKKPWSSKSLRQCYAQGAERFGWAARSSEPRSMRHSDGRLLGMGMASMMYDAKSAPTSALAQISDDGSVVVQSATCDQGTGTYTIMAQIAADALGASPDQVRFELGDTQMPRAPISAGSQTAASVGSAVQAAAFALRQKLLVMTFADPQSPLSGLTAADTAIDNGHVYAVDAPTKSQSYADILKRHHLGHLAATEQVDPYGAHEKMSLYSFGAHFAEVAVDEHSGETRITRYVAAFGAGKILNAKTARSQLIGGVVWGIGMALMEATHLHPAIGRIANPDLAEYHVPVNGDIPAMDLFFVDETDKDVNPIGVKGIGEVGTIGAAAAIANAVYHATGIRVRDLPITPDKLLA